VTTVSGSARLEPVRAVDGVNLTVSGRDPGTTWVSRAAQATIGRTSSDSTNPPPVRCLRRAGHLHLNERQLRPFPPGRVSSPGSQWLARPRRSAGAIVGDPLRIHRLVKVSGLTTNGWQLFLLVGLDPSMMDRVPHEFPGQRQRIGSPEREPATRSTHSLYEPVSAWTLP
jgi:ABC-type microcin C transport system duplicated ATPase subunit YejF